MTHWRFWMIVGLLVCGPAQGAPGAEPPPAPVEMELFLYGAVFHGDAAAGDGPVLLLHLRRTGPEWERVWGAAFGLNNSLHPGRVTEAAVSPEAMRLAVAVHILPDSWSATSGRAAYRADLKPSGQGRWEGAYEGTFRGLAVKGRASALAAPPRGPIPGAPPAARPGEHPRILFRKADLARLREKMNTPFGQAAVAKMNDAIGLGVRYQLTGDKGLAEEAMKRAEARMAEMGDGSKIERSRPWAHRMQEVALAYDLCYDAWPAGFRARVEDYLVFASERMFYERRAFDVHIQWNIASNYPAAILYGAAVAGLALWGEPGPEPAAPLKPVAGATIPPDAAAPGKGVPVVRFASGRMPGEWLFAGGLRPGPGEDPLASAGGAAKARPEAGTALASAGRSATFAPLSHESGKGYAKGTDGADAIDLTDALGREYFTTGLFYAVIENDRPRFVRLATGFGGADAYLAGQRVADGDGVRLEKGLYPLLVAAGITYLKPWARATMQPRLVEMPEAEARALAAALVAEHEEALADWRQDAAQWRRAGGADVRCLRTYEQGRELMYHFYREGVGTGGYQAGTFSAMPLEGPNRYASMHRAMFAEDVSPYNDITDYLPCHVMAHVYPAGGKPFAQDISGTPSFLIDEYLERRDMSGDSFAGLFPVAREDLKPGLLWAWNAHVGAPDGDAAKVLARGHPALVFLNYPPDPAPKPPAACMPLAWEAPDFGYYVLRSGWTGRDDFVTQVFLKARGTGGVWQRANAGTFRVMGLGRPWNWGPDFRLNNFRWMENLVMLPDDAINEQACGRLLYRRLEADGSGVVSVDLSDVYATSATGDEGRRPLLYDRTRGLRRDEAFRPSGISGLRSIAVDYSGASGAPCLLAIVDRIAGGKRKIWTWQLGGIQMYGGERASVAPAPIDRGDLDRTTVAGNAFTITHPDATLRGTMVAPSRGLSLAAEQRWMIGDVWFKSNKDSGKGVKMHSNGVFAEGGGEFFCIVTIQKGEPPAVRVEGEGLAAKATVGRVRISFDGTKLVLEK